MVQTIETRRLDHELQNRLDGEKSVVAEFLTENGVILSTFNASLTSISKTAATLTTAERVLFDDTAHLRISFSEPSIEIHASAPFSWSREGERGEWTLGCTFSPELPEELLSVLAPAADVPDRSTQSIAAISKISVNWNLDDRETIVTLLNYSQGGFWIQSVHPCPAGQRIHVHLGIGTAMLIIVALVQWQLPHEGKYLLGCSFLNQRDFDRLRARFDRR